MGLGFLDILAKEVEQELVAWALDQVDWIIVKSVSILLQETVYLVADFPSKMRDEKFLVCVSVYFFKVFTSGRSWPFVENEITGCIKATLCTKGAKVKWADSNLASNTIVNRKWPDKLLVGASNYQNKTPFTYNQFMLALIVKATVLRSAEFATCFVEHGAFEASIWLDDSCIFGEFSNIRT